MKAEHRKELETNALADRVGRVMLGIKQRPQRRTMLLFVAVGVVIVIVWFFFRRSETRRVENAVAWFTFQDGTAKQLNQLVKDEPDSPQAKSALFENMYAQLRLQLRLLATNPQVALKNLDQLDVIYGDLAKRSEGDKVLAPEALYAQAVIAETRLIKPEENWKVALDAYKVVADNHKDSAVGKLAQKRVDVLSDTQKREELLKTYRDMRIEFYHEEMPSTFPKELKPGQAPTPPTLPVPGAKEKETPKAPSKK